MQHKLRGPDQMGFAQIPDGSGWVLSDQGNVIVVTHESAMAFANAVLDAELERKLGAILPEPNPAP